MGARCITDSKPFFILTIIDKLLTLHTSSKKYGLKLLREKQRAPISLLAKQNIKFIST